MIYILVFLISLQLFVSRPLVERVLSLLPFTPLSRWWRSLPSFASSQVKHHNVQGTIKTPHPGHYYLFYIHLDRLSICCLSQGLLKDWIDWTFMCISIRQDLSFFFFFFSFEYCDLSIGSCIVAQVVISVSFLKKRSWAHAQSSALC